MKTQYGCIVQNVKQGYILQQVNCQGVMNSGVAKVIRQEYPGVYWEYKELCDSCQHTQALLGSFQLVNVAKGLAVVNLFGQHYYGKDGKQYTSYNALDDALSAFKELRIDCQPIHHPMIGAGLGGGDWNIISELITEHLGETTLWLLDKGTP